MDSKINPNLKFRMRIRLISSEYLKLYRIISMIIRLDLVKQLKEQVLRDSQVFACLKVARSLPVVPAMTEAPD